MSLSQIPGNFHFTGFPYNLKVPAVLAVSPCGLFIHPSSTTWSLSLLFSYVGIFRAGCGRIAGEDILPWMLLVVFLCWNQRFYIRVIIDFYPHFWVCLCWVCVSFLGFCFFFGFSSLCWLYVTCFTHWFCWCLLWACWLVLETGEGEMRVVVEVGVVCGFHRRCGQWGREAVVVVLLQC